MGFKKWIWEDRENKRLLIIGVAAALGAFAILKFLYPYPNFMPPDSNGYIDAAFGNEYINIWPIGYSKFLRLFSSITNSDVALVWFQFLFLQASILYFVFTVRYFLQINKWTFRIVVLFSVLNPLISHLANFVSSDSIFTALSLIWLTQIIWILKKPTSGLFIVHSLITLFAFMFRYSALYYPLISLSVFSISRTNIRLKLIGMCSLLCFLTWFIANTIDQYKKESGKAQFSAFNGWELSANALYGYAHSAQIPQRDIPDQFKGIHLLVNKHMDSISKLPAYQHPDNDVGVYYFWNFSSPLVRYLSLQMKADTSKPYFIHWARLGLLYSAYGSFLIRKRPIAYIRYFVLPNLLKYYAPPVGFMGYYNVRSPVVKPDIARWFSWTSNKVNTRTDNKDIRIVAPFTILLSVMNIVYVLSLISFIISGGMKVLLPSNKQIIWAISSLWVFNMIFSVIAAPIEMRYQIFPLLFTLSMDIFFLGYLYQSRNQPDEALQPSFLAQGNVTSPTM
jgi:hypothetical protein